MSQSLQPERMQEDPQSPQHERMQEDPQASLESADYDREKSSELVDSHFLKLFFDDYDKWRTYTRTFLQILSKRRRSEELENLITEHGLENYFGVDDRSQLLDFFENDKQFQKKFIQMTTTLFNSAHSQSPQYFEIAVRKYLDRVEQNTELDVDDTRDFMQENLSEYRKKVESIPDALPEDYKSSYKEVLENKYIEHARRLESYIANPDFIRTRYAQNKMFLLFDALSIARKDGRIDIKALKDNMFLFNLLIDDRYIPYFFIKIILDYFEKKPETIINSATIDTIVDDMIQMIFNEEIIIGDAMKQKLNQHQLKYIIKNALSYMNDDLFKIDKKKILEYLLSTEQSSLKFKEQLKSLPYDDEVLLTMAISIYFDDKKKKYVVEINDRIEKLHENIGKINASNIKSFKIIAKTLNVVNPIEDGDISVQIDQFIDNIANLLYYEQLIRKNSKPGEKIYIKQKNNNKLKKFKEELKKKENKKLINELIKAFKNLYAQIDINEDLINDLNEKKKLIQKVNPNDDEIVAAANYLLSKLDDFYDLEDDLKVNSDNIQKIFSTDILFPLKKIEDLADKLRRDTRKPRSGGGRKPKHCKNTGIKKEILGKERCIYKIQGDRKEYITYKGVLVTVKEYKELRKKPTKAKSKPKKEEKKPTKPKSKPKKEEKPTKPKPKSKPKKEEKPTKPKPKSKPKKEEKPTKPKSKPKKEEKPTKPKSKSTKK